MQYARSGFSPPPMTPFVKQLLIGLFAAYVAQLILEVWVGVPVSAMLALQPGGLAPWQLVTYVVVAGSNPIWVLFGLLVLWWVLSPFESAMGSKRTMQLVLAVALAGSLPAWIVGFAVASAPLTGTGPVWMGSFAAYIWLFRDRQMSLVGLPPMDAKQMLYVLIGISFLFFLASRNHTHFVADLGALAGGIGFVRYLRRPRGPRRSGPDKRPKRKGSGSGLRVIEGGREDDERPKWLN